MRARLQRAIRPSTTQNAGILWAKSLLDAVLFFGIFMVALPWLAHRLLPVDLPIPADLRAFLARHEKGISALQLQRDTGIGSYETAWTLLHTLRSTLGPRREGLLVGLVEVDESYVGGSEACGSKTSILSCAA